MHPSDVAALIAAGAFLMLVVVLAVPILRLRHTVDAVTRALAEVADRTGPMLGNVNTTIDNVNSALGQVHTSLDGVNLQLARVDTMTAHAQSVTANVATMTSLVTAVTSNPLVKVAAFTYGVRKATAARRKAEEQREVHTLLREQRKRSRQAR